MSRMGNMNNPSNASTYEQQLDTYMWRRKRVEVFEYDDHTCQRCGYRAGLEPCLQVHHTYYDFSRMAWEYNVVDMITLCENCHIKVEEMIKMGERFNRKNIRINRDPTLEMPIIIGDLIEKLMKRV